MPPNKIPSTTRYQTYYILITSFLRILNIQRLPRHITSIHHPLFSAFTRKYRLLALHIPSFSELHPTPHFTIHHRLIQHLPHSFSPTTTKTYSKFIPIQSPQKNPQMKPQMHFSFSNKDIKTNHFKTSIRSHFLSHFIKPFFISV